LVNPSTGIEKDGYKVMLFVTHATDERITTEAVIGGTGIAALPSMRRFYSVVASYYF
tara:strand:- start:83 stop:253 length:171 start_codon:yes stop_codon:yes gene_type:complete